MLTLDDLITIARTHDAQKTDRLQIPYRYLDRFPGPLQAANLNHWQRRQPEGKEWLVRGYQGQARAVLSSGYSIVDNSTILRLLVDLLARVPLELVRPHVEADRLCLRLTTSGTGDGHYRVGCYVANNEIRGGAIVIAPFIQRTRCTNSIIRAEGGARRAHYRLHPGFARALLKHEIGQALRLSAGMLDAVLAAEADALPDLADVVAEIGRRKQLSARTQAEVLVGSEGERTRMGLVNGLSYAAHAAPDLGVEARVALEMLAWAVLQAQGPLAEVFARQARWEQTDERELAEVEAGLPHRPVLSLT